MKWGVRGLLKWGFIEGGIILNQVKYCDKCIVMGWDIGGD
jgi:hypothetical protein